MSNKNIENDTPETQVNDTPETDASAEIKAKNETKKLVTGMAAKLAKYKKRRVKVPIDKQNEKDLYVTVQINGYTYQIKRGEVVEVPEPVAKLLERADYI